MARTKQIKHIITECYGKRKHYSDRKQAIADFKLAIECSEGHEQTRYVNVLTDLLDGLCYCTDHEQDNYITIEV